MFCQRGAAASETMTKRKPERVQEVNREKETAKNDYTCTAMGLTVVLGSEYQSALKAADIGFGGSGQLGTYGSHYAPYNRSSVPLTWC